MGTLACGRKEAHTPSQSCTILSRQGSNKKCLKPCTIRKIVRKNLPRLKPSPHSHLLVAVSFLRSCRQATQSLVVCFKCLIILLLGVQGIAALLQRLHGGCRGGEGRETDAASCLSQAVNELP